MKSFKVGVRTASDHTWVFNGLRFEERDQAESYAQDLLVRWKLVRDVFIAASDDQANATFPVPDSTYRVRRPEERLKYTPRQVDIDFARDMMNLMRDGGLLQYPSTNLRYQIDKKRQTMVLINPEELLNVEAFVIHLRTIDTWIAIGWTVEGML